MYNYKFSTPPICVDTVTLTECTRSLKAHTQVVRKHFCFTPPCWSHREVVYNLTPSCEDPFFPPTLTFIITRYERSGGLALHVQRTNVAERVLHGERTPLRTTWAVSQDHAHYTKREYQPKRNSPLQTHSAPVGLLDSNSVATGSLHLFESIQPRL